MSALSPRNAAVVLGVGESDIGQVQGMTGLGLNAQAAKEPVKHRARGDVGQCFPGYVNVPEPLGSPRSRHTDSTACATVAAIESFDV
jgi:hypothetical protein